MKYLIYTVLLVLCFNLVHGQNKSLIKKSWIKVSSENLNQSEAVPDTLYTRYYFDRNVVYVSLEPAWDGLSMNWESNENGVKIGFQDYVVNEVSDTSLVLEEPGFQRIRLLSEDYLISKSKLPFQVDSFDGKQVYRANKIITARYQKGKSLINELEKLSHGYNIRQLSRLRIEFVVDENGKVHGVKVIEGITAGLDDAMSSAILKTSGRWKSAQYNGKPIATLMTFERRYINTSPVQRLND